MMKMHPVHVPDWWLTESIQKLGMAMLRGLRMKYMFTDQGEILIITGILIRRRIALLIITHN